MAGQPPPSPPSHYVWVDERRLETLEAAVDRLTRNGVDSEGKHLSTRARLFNAFGQISETKGDTARIEGKVDSLAGDVRLLLKHFGVLPT